MLGLLVRQHGRQVLYNSKVHALTYLASDYIVDRSQVNYLTTIDLHRSAIRLLSMLLNGSLYAYLKELKDLVLAQVLVGLAQHFVVDIGDGERVASIRVLCHL